MRLFALVVCGVLSNFNLQGESVCATKRGDAYDFRMPQECGAQESALASGEEVWGIRIAGETAAAALQLSIQPDDYRWWPIPVRVTLSNVHTEQTRTFIVPGEWSGAVAFHLPAGEWTYTLEAHPYRPVGGRVEILTADQKVPLVLARPGVVSGRVQLGTNRPAIGARLYAGNELLGVVEHSAGSFEFPIPDDADTVQVSYPGMPDRWVALRETQRDHDLGSVTLLSGHRLSVYVDGPPEARVRLEVILKDDKRVLITETTIESTGQLTIHETVPGGEYRIEVRGEGPLERYGEQVIVSDEPVEKTLFIEPHLLNLSVRDERKQRVPAAVVTLASQEGRWRNEVTVGPQGTGTWNVWQEGGYSISARAPLARTGHIERRSLSGNEAWDIVLEGAPVRGVVIGSAEAPLPGSKVLLRSVSENRQRTRFQETDEEGRFSFDYLEQATHTLLAQHEGYVEKQLEVQPQVSRSVVIRLDADARLDLHVVDDWNRPIARAFVLAGSGTYPSITNSEGIVNVAVPRKGTERYFVIPREGSFAVSDLGKSESGETNVTVTNGSVILNVLMRNVDGSGLPNKAFAIRYNGRFIPYRVVEALREVQSKSFATDGSGRARLVSMPEGFYEFWPVFDFSQYPAQLAAPTAPAAAIYATAGESTIEMSFAVIGE